MAVSYPQSGCSEEQGRPLQVIDVSPEFGVERGVVGPEFLTRQFTRIDGMLLSSRHSSSGPAANIRNYVKDVSV